MPLLAAPVSAATLDAIGTFRLTASSQEVSLEYSGSLTFGGQVRPVPGGGIAWTLPEVAVSDTHVATLGTPTLTVETTDGKERFTPDPRTLLDVRGERINHGLEAGGPPMFRSLHNALALEGAAPGAAAELDALLWGAAEFDKGATCGTPDETTTCVAYRIDDFDFEDTASSEFIVFRIGQKVADSQMSEVDTDTKPSPGGSVFMPNWLPNWLTVAPDFDVSALPDADSPGTIVTVETQVQLRYETAVVPLPPALPLCLPPSPASRS